jgi:sugar lactone lactonase YvrE
MDSNDSESHTRNRSMHTNIPTRPCTKSLAACLALALGIGTTATHVTDATVGAGSASVATLAVSNCNDKGIGSLRDVVANAHSGDTVDMTGLTCSTISLTTGGIEINVDDLTLHGASALTIEGPGFYSYEPALLHKGVGTLRADSLNIANSAYSCVVSSGSVYLNHSTITHCNRGGVIVANDFTARYSSISYSYSGSGVSAQGGGSVSILNSTIDHNLSDPYYCGGLSISSSGANTTASVLISNSTISSNQAGFFGYPTLSELAGAGCIDGLPVTITNSTIAFNTSSSLNSGLRINAPSVTIESSIFANHSIYAGAADLDVTSSRGIYGHNNLIMVSKGQVVPSDTITADPKLLPLADNGGPTLTHALSADSPAIDAGNNTAGLAYDQRGAPFARVYGAKADIGAYEAQTHAVAIDSTFTGAWYDPAQSGHGIFVEVLPGNNLLAYWFTFDPAGDQQAWFLGVGPYSGNSAAITAVDQTTGGRWIPNFDPNKIVHNAWGSLTFTFTGHDHGKVDFNSVLGYGTGSMNLTRLTQPAAQTAATTSIGSPGAVVTDRSGDAYFSSSPNFVFRLDSHGTLARIAGTGAAGYSGDHLPATLAQLNFPLSYPELVNDPVDYSELVGGLAIDPNGNLYIADAYNNRVRKIDTNGNIITVAGDGTRSNSGDGNPATAAQIYWPQGVAIDSMGGLYISSAWGPLRKTGQGIYGRISTVAGSNCGSGFMGPGFCVPEEISIDAANNVFVPDSYCRVREVKTDGSILTVAGDDHDPSNGFAFTCGYSGEGGPATNAAMQIPYSVAADSNGNLFIADTFNHCIRKVDSTGTITTVAGTCLSSGYAGDGGPATSAQLNGPHGVAVDATGSLFIADTYNNRIRKVSTGGTITTIAGNGATGAIGPSFTGSWYDPAQSGHGLVLEVLPDNNLLAYWFTFNPAGNQQAWFGGVGTYSGNTATISNVEQPTGGRWIPNFNPATIVRNPWGTLTITFTDCNHGKVNFTSVFGYGSGSMDLTRLTQPAGLTCPL